MPDYLNIDLLSSGGIYCVSNFACSFSSWEESGSHSFLPSLSSYERDTLSHLTWVREQLFSSTTKWKLLKNLTTHSLNGSYLLQFSIKVHRSKDIISTTGAALLCITWRVTPFSSKGTLIILRAAMSLQNHANRLSHIYLIRTHLDNLLPPSKQNLHICARSGSVFQVWSCQHHTKSAWACCSSWLHGLYRTSLSKS